MRRARCANRAKRLSDVDGGFGPVLDSYLGGASANPQIARPCEDYPQGNRTLARTTKRVRSFQNPRRNRTGFGAEACTACVSRPRCCGSKTPGAKAYATRKQCDRVA